MLLSLDERLTRKRHLVKIPSRSSDAVRVGLEKIAELYGESVFKSVTSDNGSEFVDLGEARTKSKTLLSAAFSQRESHWITLPMNKLRLSKVGSTICHARSSITTPLILFFNLSYLILQFRIQNRCCNRKNGSEKMRKSYPSNITREHSFSRYNNAQNISYRSYVRRRVFFLLFPDLTE